MNPLEWEAPWLAVVGALFVIVMVRANATYWLGRLGVAGARRTRMVRLLDSPGYLRAARLLDRWGPPAVTLSFLTIGVQTLVNLSAGASRMSLRRYLPAVVLGCAMWAVWYGTVGVAGWAAVGALWRRSPAAAVALGVAGLAALAAFLWWQLRTRRR